MRVLWSWRRRRDGATVTGRRPGAARRHRDDDRGAAMLLSLYLILVVTALSVAVAGVVIIQVKPTLLAQTTNETVDGAQAGLDVAVNQLRAAVSTGTTGDYTKLRCASGGYVYAGSAPTGSGGTVTYSVRVRYFSEDPTSQTSTWVTANALSCSSGHPSTVPLYALLTSTSTSSSSQSGHGSRTVTQTYKFNVTNTHQYGGLIYDYNSGTGLCLQAASLTAGAVITLRTCDDTTALQLWTYDSMLHLFVTDSSTSPVTTYCLKAKSTNNYRAVLALCDAAYTDATQVWSFNDSGNFQGTSDLSTLNSYCLRATVSTPVAGTPIEAYAGCSGADLQHALSPTPKVGAGRAGDSTSQLVNFKYFGRCFDITGATVTSTYLIGYPCKMAPSNSAIKWNQKPYWDSANGMLCTNNTTNTTPTSCTTGSSSLYCLTAGTSGTSPTSGTRVLTKVCSSTNQAQKWTRQYATGTYATSYIVITKQSPYLCLDLNPAGAAEASAYNQQWGVIQVSTCDGSTRQKWNADPNLTTSNVSGTHEE